MADDRGPASDLLFPSGYRAAGILLHVTSLPSPFGIGDLGPTAFAWIDRLVEIGQSWWQILPLSPIGHGNSPYDPLSTFAGSLLLLSPERLIEEGLIRQVDCTGGSFPDGYVDYNAVTVFKKRLLNVAWETFQSGRTAALSLPFEQFCEEHAYWLDDYALFDALNERYQSNYYLQWPAEIVRHKPQALATARRELAAPIDRCRFGQFLLFRQGSELREYAHSRGVRLMGDMPFFVSPHSADAWANPEMFLLDEHCRPRVVAGVPPDYFSSTGQLWGNPVYDWGALRRTGYRWWIDRLRALLAHVEVIRLDHFRAFAAAWHVAATAETAESGQWVPGPAADFFQVVRDALGGLPFVAEDLGMITDDVRQLRDQFQLPGMRVLQFAFDGDPDNAFLPHYYVSNAVVYTGTHDNDTTRGWYEKLPHEQQAGVWKYLEKPAGPSDEVAWELISLAWKSDAALAVTPLQDVLNLGSEARMNVPGQAAGNWGWRCSETMLADPAFSRLRDLTQSFGRAP